METNLLGECKTQPLAPVHFPVVQVSLQREIWRHKPPLNSSASVSVALLVTRKGRDQALTGEGHHLLWGNSLPSRAPQGIGSLRSG